MRRAKNNRDKGFTLVEIIIAIVVAAILAAMVFSYSGTTLTQSVQPLNQAAKTMALQKVMENIFTDYNSNYKADLAGIQTKIGAEGTVCSAETPCIYGQGYTVVDNHFIKFVDNSEAPLAAGDPQNTLKVTVKNDLDETLSILLTLIVTQ